MKKSKGRPIASIWMYNPKTKRYVKIMHNNIEEYDDRGSRTRASWSNLTIPEAAKGFRSDGWVLSKKPPIRGGRVGRSVGSLALAGKRGKFIHEEISKPEEWDEIRTVVSGKHRVRLGFSDLDPETGTHKKYGIVSILHPLADSKCNILKQLKHEGLMPKLVDEIYKNDAKKKVGSRPGSKKKSATSLESADFEVSIDELVGSLVGNESGTVDQALLTQELTDMKSRADILKKDAEELARAGKALEALTKFKEASELEMAYYQAQLLSGKEEIDKRLEEILPLALHLKGTWDEIVLDLSRGEVKWTPKGMAALLQRPRFACVTVVQVGVGEKMAFKSANAAARYLATVLKETRPDYFKNEFPEGTIPITDYRTHLPKFLEKHLPEYKVLQSIPQDKAENIKLGQELLAEFPPFAKAPLVEIKARKAKEPVGDMPDTFFPLDELEEVDVE